MRIFLTLISASALLVIPSMANAGGFNSDFSQTITGPMKLEVVVSDDLAHRANNLPEKLSDRPSRRLNATFGNNGQYGEKAISYLIDDMSEELLRDFSKRGIRLNDSSATILRVTIEDAKPNRPTFRQLSKDTSLSFQSFGIGGADVSAEVISAGGGVIGRADYSYYSTLNDHPFRPIGTWEDTNRAFDRFSKKLSKKLAANGAATSS
jgi:hypothetical protein